MNERIPQIRVAEPRDRFTRLEAEALSRWRAPEPPEGFSDRLLARARAEGAGIAAPARMPPMRGLAVAALALMVLGGLFSMRALMGAGGASPDYQPAGFTGQDAGPRPEVRAPFDGTEAQAS